MVNQIVCVFTFVSGLRIYVIMLPSTDLPFMFYQRYSLFHENIIS